MGSYAKLHYNHFEIGEWKSYIPLEPFILFTQDDLVQELKTDEENTPYQTCKFVTSASIAKQRLDIRGFDKGACKRLFDEFRSDILWDFNVETGEHKFIENDINFKQFIEICERVYNEFDTWIGLNDFSDKNNPIKDPEIKKVFDDDFFDDTSLVYHGDVLIFIMMRIFLEIIPQDATVVFDLTDLYLSEYFNDDDIPVLCERQTKIMLRRIGIDYQLYGYVIQNDPSIDRRLRNRISSFSEDSFIEHVLHPLLIRMGYVRVRKVQYHGRNEFGSDILPFRYRTPLGIIEYYAVQAKAVPIHGTSAKTGNAGELISQTLQALSVTFVDSLDNEPKKLDKFVIASNKAITPDARKVIEDAVQGKRYIVFLDIDQIVDLVKENKLIQYLLFTEINPL